MTQTSPSFVAPRRHRIVLVFLGISLLWMLGVLLVERITNPSLVVVVPTKRVAESSGMPAMSGMPEMSEIGALMQKVRANPADIDLKNKLTEALMNENQWDAAENFAKRAHTQDPKNAQSAFLLGIILHRKGDFSGASEALEKSLALAEDAHTRYSLAVLYLYFVKDRDKGLSLLREGLEKTDLPPDMKQRFEAELKQAETEHSANVPEEKKGTQSDVRSQSR